MMKNKKSLTAKISAALLLSAALCGCSGQPAATDLTLGITGRSTSAPGQTHLPSETAQPDISSGLSSPAAQTADASAATEFAVKLFRQNLGEELKNDPKKNVLISPLSVLYALSMTANGAKGQTLEQMENVLGAAVPALNAYLYQYRTSLSQDEGGRLSLANSIWFKDDPGFTVKEDFLAANADWYEAGLYKAPFDSSTVKEINKWVSDNTDKMIPSILEQIPDDTVMYLINALAFDAEWETIYREDQVRKSMFTEEDGTRHQIELMYSSGSSYLRDSNAQGFIKYYKGRKYAFAALLPDEGVSVAEYAAALDGKALRELLSNPVNTLVKTAIPKFEADYDVEMSEIFAGLGMTDAFDDGLADFSGIGSSSKGPLYISKILHKTYIGVNEKGTRAGAATAVAVQNATAVQPEPVTVYLDRPFVYMIIDCEEQVPVFIGAFMSAG